MSREIHIVVTRAALPVLMLVTLLCRAVPTHAGPVQEMVTVTGRVVATADSRPLPGAVVTAGTNKVTADTDGRFSLTVALGPLRVVVSAPGFIDQPIDLCVILGAFISRELQNVRVVIFEFGV